MNFEQMSREELVERLRVLEHAPSQALPEPRFVPVPSSSGEPDAEQRRDRERLQLLSDTGRALASTLDPLEMLCRIARLAVPRLADWVVFHRWDGQRLRLGCVAHHDEATEQSLAERLAPQELTPEHATSLVAQVARTRRAVLLARATRAHEVFGLDLAGSGFEGVELRACLGVPVLSGPRLLGTMFLCAARSELAYEPRDLSVAEELAARTGLALDNARLYQEAQEAIRSRDNLMAIVSHDLRNPLNTIALNLSLLTRPWDGQEGQDRRKGRSQLESIRRSVERVGRMVEDLLAASTIQAGHFSVRSCAVPPEVLLEDVVQALEPMAAHQDVHFEAHFPPSLPAVRCDRDRVLQVFANLCTNALHVLQPGGALRVTARVEAGFVVFTVADTGPGIPPGQLAAVFDRYWQAEPGSSSGVGLGLYIVKGIVEAHGGRAWAESAPGEGARFSFTLPLAA